MRLLFEMDRKDYDPNGDVFRRLSSRGIIFRDGLVAVSYSRKNKHCEFPGGGVEAGEDSITAMMREVREETGLIVKPETIREFGRVHMIKKGRFEPVYIQDTSYYFCEVEDRTVEPQLTASEIRDDFVTLFVPIEEAIKINEEVLPCDKCLEVLVERELRVMEMIRDQMKDQSPVTQATHSDGSGFSSPA